MQLSWQVCYDNNNNLHLLGERKMTYYDLECPYCEEKLKINHDEGFGYAENKKHEMQCEKCDKYFTFTTSITYTYYPEKADCLNGEEHILEFTHTYPYKYTEKACETCDFSRDLTEDEKLEFIKLKNITMEQFLKGQK